MRKITGIRCGPWLVYNGNGVFGKEVKKLRLHERVIGKNFSSPSNCEGETRQRLEIRCEKRELRVFVVRHIICSCLAAEVSSMVAKSEILASNAFQFHQRQGNSITDDQHDCSACGGG